jgi:glucosyl-3-phosphoglycerate synthase
VKGFYDRPGDGGGGGRVTELVARPLLRHHAPQLLGFAQPLAGECAFVREPLLRLPFVSGYGVETGMLLQVLRTHGLDALAQTDLGVRVHSQQDLHALAKMTIQIESAVTLCLHGGSHLEGTHVMFTRNDDGAMEMCSEPVRTWLLPPLMAS